MAAASIVDVLALLAAWFYAARSAHSWAAERRESEDALQQAHDDLEAQVKQRTVELSQLVNFDALTGLPNRILLTDRISQAISIAQRNRESLTLMFLDLDHFKNVNDSLGHYVGDELLILLAERLKALVREEDTVSRLGGDEFIIVLKEAGANGAIRVATKLLEVIAQPCLIGQLSWLLRPQSVLPYIPLMVKISIRSSNALTLPCIAPNRVAVIITVFLRQKCRSILFTRCNWKMPSAMQSNSTSWYCIISRKFHWKVSE